MPDPITPDALRELARAARAQFPLNVFHRGHGDECGLCRLHDIAVTLTQAADALEQAQRDSKASGVESDHWYNLAFQTLPTDSTEGVTWKQVAEQARTRHAAAEETCRVIAAERSALRDERDRTKNEWLHEEDRADMAEEQRDEVLKDRDRILTQARAELGEMQSQLAASHEQVRALEGELRHTWWLNHGHFGTLYGDDGEMQCPQCPADYKRDPLEDLRVQMAAVAVARWEQALATSAPPLHHQPCSECRSGVVSGPHTSGNCQRAIHGAGQVTP